MVAVFAVADGTDGEDDTDVGTTTAEQVDGAAQVVGTLIGGELLLLEERGGALLTVVDYLARLLQAVDVVGAEGDKHDTRLPLVPLNGMQHGDGVVHRAERIDRDTELLVLEAAADAVGKATAHKEHFLTRLNLEGRLRNINYGPELHQLLLICNPVFESVMSTKRAFGARRFSLRMVLIRAAASGSLATM